MPHLYKKTHQFAMLFHLGLCMIPPDTKISLLCNTVQYDEGWACTIIWYTALYGWLFGRQIGSPPSPPLKPSFLTILPERTHTVSHYLLLILVTSVSRCLLSISLKQNNITTFYDFGSAWCSVDSIKYF